jgi:MoaA/NifB/PqqE/SkfB family radical SAM enzyme
LSAETIKRIIDEAYALGTRVVMLQGGEPLLHPDIGDIIKHVVAKKMYCAITTNAVFIEKHIDVLKLVDQVQISIDGSREITDRYRGAGVFDAVVRALAVCHKEHIPIHLHAVITNESTEENTLQPLITLAKKYKTYLNFCIPNPSGAAESKVFAAKEHIQIFYRLLIKKKKEGMPTNTSYHAMKSIIEWGEKDNYGSYVSSNDRDTIKLYRYKPCVMGNLVAWLDTRGFLHPCAVHFGQAGFAYSIHDHGFARAWERLRDKPCYACPNSSEFNSLFNLKLEALLNALKFILRWR